MAVGAFTLAKLSEARAEQTVPAARSCVGWHTHPNTQDPSQARHSVTGHCAFLPKKLICNEKYLSALNLEDI